MTPENPRRPTIPQNAKTGRRPAPYVTYAVIAVCVVNFLVLNLATGSTLATARSVLAPTSFEVWHGAFWGLVTSAFVHIAIWHLAFNMWWARDFGRLLEPDLGRARYAGFIVATATASSAWELLTTGATGIGFSGVVYAMFGYLLARRGSHKAYAAFLTPKTIRWMLGWLVLCIVLTIAKVWTVANGAHLAGLATGWLLGTALENPRRRRAAMAAGAVLAAGIVLSLTYMPWSALWRARDPAYSITMWRERAEAGDPHAAAMYATLLAHWPQTRPDGIRWFRRAAEAGDAVGMNGAAWWLATAREDALRNGPEAVKWAELARAAAPSANAEDTLAAAYAEVDRWDDALAAQDRALQDGTAEEKPLFEQHRLSYARHEKWRE